MKSLLQIICCLMLSISTAFAGGIKGHVFDQKTGEPLPGVTILLQPSGKVAVSGLDGAYAFKEVSAGNYTLVISHLTYKSLSKAINVVKEDNARFDVYLSEKNSKELTEVVIAASGKASSENTARKLEQKSPVVMNAVSGAAIEVSPDLTVASVIQRISGISIERSSNGEGQYAILRGMDKRYNNTLINGVKIPSPDNKYRYVPLDLFPADLLERLEVYKSLTPNMEGDAVGGVVNMVMKDATPGLQLNANLGAGYSQMVLNKGYTSFSADAANTKSPYEIYGRDYKATQADFNSGTMDYKKKNFAPNTVGGLSVGQRFLNNKLGVILAGSYQNTFRTTTSSLYGVSVDATDKFVVITNQSERLYSEQQRRSGLHAKVDYVFNDQHKISFYNAFMSLSNFQTRDGLVTNIAIGNYDAEKGNAQLTYETRTRRTDQQIYNGTLHGDHELLHDRLKLQWSAVVSSARNDVPDNTTIDVRGVRSSFQETRTTVDRASRRWERNTDNDLAGYLDLTYKARLGGAKADFSVGGLYRDKQRSSFYNNYTLFPSNINALYGKDFLQYTDIKWDVQNPGGAVANAFTYDASEKVAAGYGMFHVKGSRLDVTGGVRIEHTDQGYHMFFPQGENKPVNSQVYTDVLPSLNLKYELKRHQQLRASYFRSINRPGFFEIVPGKMKQEEYVELGNADLKHAVADNFDLRYEWFPKAGDQLLIGAFYKIIANPIEYTLRADSTRGQDIYYTPGNFGTARNYGLEVDFIHFFNMLGVKANYTYTHSAITTAKSTRIRDDKGDLKTISVDQTRPLFGQSAHIANLSLLYKDVRHGWDAQLAGAYTGPRITTVFQFVDNDFWQKGFVQMDLSVEKHFRKHFTVYAKAGNLLNTPATIFIKGANERNKLVPGQKAGSNETIIRKDYYGQTYLLGFRYKL
ncbi:TonB-dependent receptor [Chitinophaga dinghuensis]|uniref:TonB-dependent receptor n=1 Tax=Chitinophaga dinghuensis TaxID=1539050 RepID=A0A327WDI9_9BACT|nr:TonB-dependent receptor [Chitinophaga dinghuensis]RAJ87982.1 TonB-dependent receptor [Chitinophaga dinghuensis]